MKNGRQRLIVFLLLMVFTIGISSLAVRAAEDTEAPVITLNGDAEINLTVGDVFVDPGVTVTDNVYGDLTDQVVVGGDTVDTNTAATYVITYDVSDPAGNAAAQVTRTVVVQEAVAAATVISIEPSTREVKVNDEFTVEIKVAPGVPILSVQVDVRYDRTVLQTQTAWVVEGDLFKGDGATTHFGKSVKDNQGLIDNILCMRMPPAPVSGEGTLARLTFKAKAAGTTDITFEGVTVSDAAVQPATYETMKGRVTVTSETDNTAPVITLNGAAAMTLAVGDSFTDPGATALDNVDGDISHRIVVGGDTVDTNTAGTYVITYDVSDAAGNAAAQATRTVVVQEAVAAATVISIEPSTKEVKVNDEFTVEIKVVPGEPIVSVQADVRYDNAVLQTKTAWVVEGDLFKGDGVTTYFGKSVKDAQGLIDNILCMRIPSAPISGEGILARVTFKARAAGTTDITFEGVTVSDAAVQPATYEPMKGRVTVTSETDSTAPVITLNGAAAMTLAVGDSFTDPGATALDNVDGDISHRIVVGGDTVDTSTPGTYVITYDVSDTAGNAAVQATRTVAVTETDSTAPVITLNGAAAMTLAVGDSFTDPGATALDNVDGDISDRIVVGGDTVDTNTAGTYVITYDVSDAAGNAAVRETRTVTVTATDSTVPVITLNGPAEMVLVVGDSFTDPGATALDNVDGDISDRIVVGGDTVDTNTVGTYVITYDVSNAAGNAAIQATRTVRVVESIPVTGDDWEQFQNDLYNSGVTSSPAPLSPVEVGWKVRVGHADPKQMAAGVNNTPLVVDSKVLVMGALADTWLLDAKTGDAVWDKQLSRLHQKFQLATPVYGDGRYFVATNDGHVYALAAGDGAEIWQKDLFQYAVDTGLSTRSLNVLRNNAQLNSPLKYDDGKIYLGVWGTTQTDLNYYFCMDAENGQVLWGRKVTSGNLGYYWSGPCVIGDYLLYGDQNNYITCVNKTTGDTVSEIKLTDIDASGGWVRCSVSYSPETGCVYFGDEGASSNKGGNLWAFDFNTATGELTHRWHKKLGILINSTPAIYNGRLYVGTNLYTRLGDLFCLDAATGEEIWKFTPEMKSGEDSGGYYSEPGIQASPTIYVKDGKPYIYFTTICAYSTVYCLDENGQKVWEFENEEAGLSEGYTTCSIAISDGWVYFGNDGGYVYGLKAAADTTAPVITLNGLAEMTLTVGASFTDPGATAEDNVDGDISNRIVVGGDTVDTNTAGTYVITYDVSDTAGNPAVQVTRTVTVTATDITAPVITLNGAAVLTLTKGASFTDPGATAQDDVDGDISDRIVVGGDTVDTNTVGTYVLTYNVSDTAGNPAAEISRTVIVQKGGSAPNPTDKIRVYLSIEDMYGKQRFSGQVEVSAGATGATVLDVMYAAEELDPDIAMVYDPDNPYITGGYISSMYGQDSPWGERSDGWIYYVGGDYKTGTMPDRGVGYWKVEDGEKIYWYWGTMAGRQPLTEDKTTGGGGSAINKDEAIAKIKEAKAKGLKYIEEIITETITLPQEVIKELVKEKMGVKIRLENAEASLVIPTEALSGDNDLEISIKTFKGKEAEEFLKTLPAEGKALTDICDFNVLVLKKKGGDTEKISWEQSPVIILSYQGMDVEEDTALAVYCYNEETGQWQKVENIEIDRENKEVKAFPPHLSKFVLMEMTPVALPPPVSPEPAPSFSDVGEDHWAKGDIDFMLSKEIIAGYPDGTFKPDKPVTRAEFTRLLVRVLAIPEVAEKSVFSDVQLHDWYNGAIAAAYQKGLVSGYDTGHFYPDNPVTREEAAALLVNALQYQGKIADQSPAPAELEKLNDREEISAWARNAVALTLQENYLHGFPDGTFKPRESTTRAQTVAMLRLLYSE